MAFVPRNTRHRNEVFRVGNVGVFIGDQIARRVATINDIVPLSIVNCTPNLLLNVHAYPVGTRFFRIPLPEDNTFNYTIFNHELDEAIDFMITELASGRNVLIHCSSGINRSATVMIALMVYLFGHSIQTTANVLHTCAPATNPKPYLLAWLNAWEATHHYVLAQPNRIDLSPTRLPATDPLNLDHATVTNNALPALALPPPTYQFPHQEFVFGTGKNTMRVIPTNPAYAPR